MSEREGRRSKGSRRPAQAFMAIKVPEGHKVGDRFNVRTPDGQWMQVQVPEGVQPGQDLTMAYEPLPVPEEQQPADNLSGSVGGPPNVAERGSFAPAAAGPQQPPAQQQPAPAPQQPGGYQPILPQEYQNPQQMQQPQQQQPAAQPQYSQPQPPYGPATHQSNMPPSVGDIQPQAAVDRHAAAGPRDSPPPLQQQVDQVGEITPANQPDLNNPTLNQVAQQQAILDSFWAWRLQKEEDELAAGLVKKTEKVIVEVPKNAKSGSTVVVRLKDDSLVKFKVPDGFEQLSEFQGPYVAMEYDTFVHAGA